MAATATISHFLSKFDVAKHPFHSSHKLSRNRSSSLCIRPNSSKHSNSSTSLETSPQQQQQPRKPQSPIPPKPVNVPESNPSVSLFDRLRDGFKIDELGLEILSIALPAALALAADPIASLVDTAFVGHLGSVELAAVGVSVSIFNLVSKLFNVPLLNITTSFVAEEQALISKSKDDGEFEHQGKKVLPSVSTSLALAAGLGIAEASLVVRFFEIDFPCISNLASYILSLIFKQIGLATGFPLAVFLFIGFEALSGLFTTDAEVLQIAWSGTLFVAGSQPVNAVAFVLDGLYYGVSDYEYAAVSMVVVGLISSAFLLVAAPLFSVGGVWTGLFLFMTLRVVAGFWRLGTKSGPWKMIYCDMEKEKG
ncbi:hypothetical protein GOBAR_DD13356 [Gossypium barbadense]|nr:hypothetical protein GOBAR_DD13356 [Gossypium barbadense]